MLSIWLCPFCAKPWRRAAGRFTERRRGRNRDEEELRSYCKAGLAHFKVPRHIWIVDEFPKTGSGKLHKPRMREMTMDRLKKG
ncbi:MAG: hypothetical protein PHC98_09485 [Syntrophotalea acetylenica]|uniref:AMP-binding enzyme n=1 Tax=Syntrophotalea acetylenica TaxID=29542 RepID=UPI002A365D53|nr:hypothetical protein [Syntrophotalea acetylenica]MDD4457794.1 hypothetical protein [Syntrophotalea acetylenica]MDY0262045.1 hypothetical protein [Syntrophotalea acetylenica]